LQVVNAVEAVQVAAAVAAGTSVGVGVGGGEGETAAVVASTHRVGLDWGVHRHWPLVLVQPL